jgi:RimJ/RimL family protein N-acetyltransferase
MRLTFGSSTLIDWVEHYIEQRRAVRAGLRVPFLALHEDGRVIGEMNFHIDPISGSAELSIWFGLGTPRATVQWITASALFRAFALPARIPRTTAPIAVTNPGPRRLLAHYGFTEVAMARELRELGGERVDHDIWWLDRGADHLAGLARGMTDPTL